MIQMSRGLLSLPRPSVSADFITCIFVRVLRRRRRGRRIICFTVVIYSFPYVKRERWCAMSMMMMMTPRRLWQIVKHVIPFFPILASVIFSSTHEIPTVMEFFHYHEKRHTVQVVLLLHMFRKFLIFLSYKMSKHWGGGGKAQWFRYITV